MLEKLYYVSLAFAIGALVVNFVIGRLESREKKKENDALRSSLENLTADQARRFDAVQATLNELVAQGRVSKEDAGRLLQIFVHEAVELNEALGIEVIRPSQPDPKE